MNLSPPTDLHRYLRTRGVLDPATAVAIAHVVAVELGEAHKHGRIHRDVAPRNILLYHDGTTIETITIKLTNWVASDIDLEGMTLNSIWYRSPEVFKGETIGPMSDIYSLGCVLYEMLCGRRPFDGEIPTPQALQHINDQPIPPSRFNPGISPELEAIILRCLEKKPEQRFSDGGELAAALGSL